jgi:hypothetical protein
MKSQVFGYYGDARFIIELKQLQGSFASTQFSDFLDQRRRRSQFNKTSITRNRGEPLLIKELLNMRLRIDGSKTHGRPHIHIDYGKNRHAASYAIDDGARLSRFRRLDQRIGGVIRSSH